MSAKLLSWNIFKRIGIAVLVVVLLFCGLYAGLLSSMEIAPIDGGFYFLVSQDVRVEAGAEFTKLEGGAGYVLEEDGTHYVAISVFLNRESAQSVQKRLEIGGKKTAVLYKGTTSLYFKGKEKKKRKVYLSALKLLKSYIELLDNCVIGLERVMTQEACKRILKILEKQFSYTQNAYKTYPAFQKICKTSAMELHRIFADTVYVKDLRYLLCYQADAFSKLCSAFSI